MHGEAGGRRKETQAVNGNCFCSTLRRTPLSPPCDNANVADEQRKVTPPRADGETLTLTFTAHHGGTGTNGVR